MTDQSNAPRPAAPVLPSRAAGEVAQPVFSQPAPGAPPPQPYVPPPLPPQAAPVMAPTAPPMFQDPPAPALPRRRPAKAKKKAERLSAAEIVRLNKARAAKLAKARKAKPAKKVKVKAKQAARARTRAAVVPPAAVPVAATNYHRPTAVSPQPAPRKPGRPAKAATARKNPNRPLELKQQMLQMVKIVRELSPAEVEAFTGLVPQLQDLDRSQRKRVLDALAYVYK